MAMTDDTRVPAAPPAATTPPGPPPPWLQRWEIAAVLAVSLGASALYALLSFIGSLTAKQSLSHQTATLNGSLAPGYLLSRLDRLGVRPGRAIVLSAVIRGSYHLYQGAGAFLGNAVMGLIFGYLYRRWGRVMPLIIAHFLIDAVTFVGYALLAGHVS